MQRYTIFFIIVDALHVLGGFSTNHQEFKNCTHSIWYMPGLPLLPLQPNHACGSSGKPGMYQMLCVEFLSS
jgi:hypothetical protein